MRYASPSAWSASLTRAYKIEYIIVNFDHEKSVARLSLRGPEILDEFLHEEIEANKHGYAMRAAVHRYPANLAHSVAVTALWRPEYGRHMVEGTPGSPYGSKFADLLTVEGNMASRYATRLLCVEALYLCALIALAPLDVLCDPTACRLCELHASHYAGALPSQHHAHDTCIAAPPLPRS